MAGYSKINQLLRQKCFKDGDIIRVSSIELVKTFGYYINDEWIALAHRQLPIGKCVKHRLALIYDS